MKRFFIALLSLICSVCCLGLFACGNDNVVASDGEAPVGDETQTPSGDGVPPESEEGNTMYIIIGDTTLTATLVDNSSTKALKKLLPLTIQMHDYGNFEKVGSLGTSLPRNDEQISTDAGDLILYQGNSFVIYYDTNSWNFTRLGKINDVSKSELKRILGDGNVTVTLSLEK